MGKTIVLFRIYKQHIPNMHKYAKTDTKCKAVINFRLKIIEFSDNGQTAKEIFSRQISAHGALKRKRNQISAHSGRLFGGALIRKSPVLNNLHYLTITTFITKTVQIIKISNKIIIITVPFRLLHHFPLPILA